MNSSPTDTLRAEHQVILRVLNVLQEIMIRSDRDKRTDYDTLALCIKFFKLFADACHHGKEEDVLFPELEAKGIPREGGPIGVMLAEHVQARALVDRMAEALADASAGDSQAQEVLFHAGRCYIDLLRRHIGKEDHCLFAMAEHVLDAASCQRICKNYTHACAARLQGHTAQELEQLAADLEKRIA